MSGILKEESNNFTRFILLEVTLYLNNQKWIMWSPLDSKLRDKRKNLGTTNDLDQWFLNLTSDVGD